MVVATEATLFRKMKNRECRVRVIICRMKEIFQVMVVATSREDVDEVMIPAIYLVHHSPEIILRHLWQHIRLYIRVHCVLCNRNLV